MTHHGATADPLSSAEEYPDDGHIFVCVRVRDVPHHAACLTNGGNNGGVNANSSTRTSTVTRKSMARDAQKICVSVVENVVVMHDPKAVDDAAIVAKDGNNVVQLLTDRANRGTNAGAGSRPSRKTTGAAAAAAAANIRTNSRRTTTTIGGGGGGRAGNHLISTGTANYYECDHCITSMEQAQLLQMPLIRTSDFLQPPPYGTQEDVYRRTAMHAVRAAVDGINSCVFAYGQTGSGKTYTLFGDTSNIRRDPGVVPRTVDDLFCQLEAVREAHRGNETTDYSYNVQLSFFEIYQNEVYCLFSRQGPLHVQFLRDPAGKKETMVIHDLQQQTVTAADKAYPLIEMGLRRRQTAETGMNARSSRSHAILQIRVAQYRTNRDTRETVEHQATINLVDLAGSERQKTANTDGKSRDEGIQINQSLATLARVINDIASGAKFVNYRDSLLTMVLKDNLGGNSKTFMIANISPIAFSFAESCATLTYAKDVRKIRNRPMVNKTFQTRANLLEQNARLKGENEKLKEQMEAWVRSLQSGGAGAMNLESMPMYRAMRQRIASSDALLGLSPISSRPVSPPPQQQQQQSSGQRGATAYHAEPSAHDGIAAAPFTAAQLCALTAHHAAGGCSEAFLSAACAGLTAPLLIASHRRYTSVAGIGGSCVEGGVVRVSALVQETMRFPLRRVLNPVDVDVAGAATDAAATEKAVVGERLTTVMMDDSDDDDDEGDRHSSNQSRRASPSPDAVPTDQPLATAAGANAAAAAAEDLGVLLLDRVALRSCEQRYYVHFQPPATADGLARLIDVQVNGKSIGAKSRRELHHGDVICAYLEDGGSDNNGGAEVTTGLRAQSLVSFHYVDLNAFARNTSAAFGAATTLGQIAVSVDIPEDLENLTLDGIKQLQRDNAKLLDLVRQQAETLDFQCARASVSPASRGNGVGRLSPFESPQSESPDPRSLETSPSAVMPPHDTRTTTTAAATAEAFRRLSEPAHCLRGDSVMPADIEADALLRRAAAQSESQQRLDSAVKENEKLHRTVVSRNATLDALARRLAELEADDDDNNDGAARRSARSSTSASSSSAASSGASSAASASVSLSPSAARDAKGKTLSYADHHEDADADDDDVSLTRVSSPSAQRDPSPSPKKRKAKAAVAAAEEDGDDDVIDPTLKKIGDGKQRVVYENTEGARERYQAAVREREQYDRILELEALLRELREQLAEMDSRLRFAKDETLEQQMFREQAEAERAALLEEISEVRRENSELRSDNASLEAFLAKDEQALADAARLAQEELDRQTSLLADRIKALKALARMWKQKTMKYIAMGYGAGENSNSNNNNNTGHLDAIPWDDLRAAETVAIAKRRLGGTASTGCSPNSSTDVHRGNESGTGCTAEMASTIEAFERDTAEDNLRALEYALLDFEQENQRLLDEMRRLQAELQRYKDLISRLRTEKAAMERELADATDATEEERRRLQHLLQHTNEQLGEAERDLKATQGRLDEAQSLCDNNKRKAVRSNELLLAQQKRTIEELEAQLARLRGDVAARDEELRNLARYVEDHDSMGGEGGGGGAVKGLELRSRIEEMVADTMDDYDAPTGYSVFPTGYEFSEEMVALIRICLRILLDRLKMELYVLNSQSVHKFGLLIHAVKARTEAHFHTFMHQLRDAVSQMTGRVVRPGGKWGLSEADVLSNLVDHRRRQVGDALNGLLIWYDHWDSAPKTEHVAYMELIRNADRIMQMARLVRRESLLNTNATSTSLMPIPGKTSSSEKSLVGDGAKRKDKTVRESCKILARLNSSTRQGNLARAVNQFSATPSRATIAGREDGAGAGGGGSSGGVDSTPFRRSATVTALALSQSMIPFSRTATGTRGSVQQQPLPATSAAGGGAAPSPAEACPPFTRCPSGLPRPSTTAAPQLPLNPAATASAFTSTVASAESMSTPMRPTKPSAVDSSVTKSTAAAGGATVQRPSASPAAAVAGTTAAARANYSRMASAGVLPVSDADVAYVATTDVAEAVSINTYNFSRRMSATPADMGEMGGVASSTMRRPNHLFSRCHTTAVTPQQQQQQQQRESHTLRRQASAVPLKTRVSGGGGGAAGHPNGSRAAEAFARSKTQYTTAIPPPVPSRVGRGTSEWTGRGSIGSVSRSSVGSPSVRGSHQPSASLTAFSGGGVPPTRSSGSDPRESRRRSGTLHHGSASTSAAAHGGLSQPPGSPFYSPSVLQSLRERSTSDANRAAPSDRKLSATATGAKKKAPMSGGRGSGGVVSGKAPGALSRTNSGVPAKKKTAAHKAPAEGRRSAGGVAARLSLSENDSSVPHVPRLNFTGMAGNY